MWSFAGISPIAKDVRNYSVELILVALTNSVARSREDLKTIGQGLARTVVDEVVLGGGRLFLLCFIVSNFIGSIIERTLLDGIGKKSKTIAVGLSSRWRQRSGFRNSSGS